MELHSILFTLLIITITSIEGCVYLKTSSDEYWSKLYSGEWKTADGSHKNKPYYTKTVNNEQQYLYYNECWKGYTIWKELTVGCASSYGNCAKADIASCTAGSWNDWSGKSVSDAEMVSCTSSKLTPAPTLPQVTTPITITNENKQYLTQQHNYYRSQVALGKINGYDGNPLPKAAKMPAIAWDDSIAQNAQKWANTCNGGHSSLPHYSSESIIWGYNNNDPLQDATRSWADEHKNYIYGQTGEPHGVVGHFTNIIQEKATKFGCGFAHCPKGYDDPTYNEWPYWFVCGYGYGYDNVVYTKSDTTGSQCTNVNAATGLCL